MPRASAIAFVVAALLVPGGPAVAALAERASVEDLARTSDTVVRGRVVSLKTRAYKGRITTTAEVEIATVWRGTAQRMLKVRSPGGEVGGIGQRVDGVAEFTKGEDVVLFLVRSGNSYRVNGLAQGKFRVEGDVARPTLEGTKFVGVRSRAGERIVEEMSITELDRRVRQAR